MANRKDKTQTTSAAKAGFSERSARRIESGQRQLGPIKTLEVIEQEPTPSNLMAPHN